MHGKHSTRSSSTIASETVTEVPKGIGKKSYVDWGIHRPRDAWMHDDACTYSLFF